MNSTAPADLIPAAIADAVIESTVREVNELARHAGLELALQLGKLIVDRFYGADLTAWRTRGTSDASLRKLAAHPELQVSASGLSRAIGVYDLCTRLEGVSGLKHLAVGHYRAVLGLKDKPAQRLLTSASEKEWTVEKLETEARKWRKGDGASRGRKPDPHFVKGIRRLGKVVEEGDSWFDDLDRVDELDAEEAEALWKTVTGVKLRCEELQARLAGKVQGFGEG